MRRYGDLLQEHAGLPPSEWAWEGVLEVGDVAVLGGNPKKGKSTFAYQLAVAVAQGRSFLGRSTRQGPVMIVVPWAEMSCAKALAYLHYAGASVDDPLWLEQATLDTSGLVKSLLTRAAEHRITFAVVDAYGTVFCVEDEDDNAEAIRRLGPFVQGAREACMTTVLLHHLGKRTDGTAIGTIRGASALGGIVDKAGIFRGVAGYATQRSLTWIGRYVGTPAPTLALDFCDGRYVPLASPEEARSARALAALDGEWRTVEEVATVTGDGRDATKRALEAHYAAGAVERCGGVKGDPSRYRRATNHVEVGAG